jgi:hypothetical protein
MKIIDADLHCIRDKIKNTDNLKVDMNNCIFDNQLSKYKSKNNHKY